MKKVKPSRYLAFFIIVLFIVASLVPSLRKYEDFEENFTNAKPVSLSTEKNNDGWNITELVSAESSSDSKYSSLVVDSSGTVYIAWRDETAYGNSGSDIDIFYKYKPAGGSWSTTEVVSTESTSDSYSSPSLTVDNSGTIHVVWDDWTSYSDSGNDFDIYYKYKSAGGSWSTTEVVSTESNGYSYCPSLAVDSAGKIHVAWQDVTNYSGSSSDTDIFYKYKPAGGGWSATEVVSTESTRSSSQPSLIVDSSSTIHVIWQDETPYVESESDYDIFYKYKPAGESWSSTEVVSTESTSNSKYPSSTVESNGTIHVAWQDGASYGESGSDYDIFYKYKSADDIWTTTQVVSTESASSSYCPSLFLDSSDMVHVVWTDYMDYDDSGSGPNIFYKHKSAEGSWSSPELVSTESTYCWDPSLFVDSSEIVHVAWQDDTDYDESGNDYDIFYKYKMGGNQPPNPPTLISPGYNSEPGEIIYENTPTFQWENLPDADYYGLYISKYPYGPANLVYDSEEDYTDGKIYGTSFNELPSDILEYGEKYRWNMRSHNTNGWSLFSDHLYFELSDMPQCFLRLEKDGKEIDNIDMGLEFDIHIYDYTDNIDKVRFLSDEDQNGTVDDGFIWTEWFDWDTSFDSWNADDKILKWTFYSGGEKEIHAEIKDKNGLESRCSYAGIYANFYFVHITDTHIIHEEWPIYLDKENSVSNLDKTLKKIKNFAIPPSFVINSGDVVDCGGSGDIGANNYLEYRSLINGIKSNWYINWIHNSDFTIPIYHCPGNHDHRIYSPLKGSIPWTDVLDNYIEYIDHQTWYKSWKDETTKTCIISIDSGYDKKLTTGTKWPPVGTGLDPEQVDLLESELDDLDGSDNNKDTSDYKKIIFMHHPVIYYRKNEDWKHWGGYTEDGIWDAGCITSEKERFLDACDKYDVDIVLSGHTHKNRVYNRDMDGTYYWSGYTNFPIHEDDKPLYVITDSTLDTAFRIIEFKQDEIIVHKEKFVEDKFKAKITGCPVELHLYDEYGNHVGRNNTNGVDLEIENVSYSFDPLFVTNETNSSKWNHTIEEISIPYGNGKYKFIMKGTGDGDFNFSTTKQLSDGNRTYLYYNNISIFENSIGKMNIDGEAVDPIIYFDDDGDGNNDREIKPDYFYGEDNSNPNVQILKPENKFYLRNKELFSFPIPLILGEIEIEIDAFDNISGINYVKIFVDNKLKANITSGDLVFNWEEKTFGKHTIKTVAYDYAGNPAEDTVIVRKFF